MTVLYLSLYIFCVIAALACALFSAWSDMRGLRIPNLCNLLVALAAVGALLASHMAGVAVMENWRAHALAAAILFGLTFLMFLARALGAGDSKMAAAFGLWAGLTGLIPFVFYMTMLGGLVGLAALVLRHVRPFRNPEPGGWIARIQAGENKIPYGVALAGAAFIMFWEHGYLSPQTFFAFMGNG